LGFVCLPGFIVGLMLWFRAHGAFTTTVIFVALNTGIDTALAENHEMSSKMSDIVSP
jgi:hypothetical protein